MMTQPTYFRPTSDVGFHKIFCTEGNDELVIQLLNAVIDDKTIVSFERLDPVHTVNTETYCTFDIYCKCDDGERIIVECQNRCGASNFMNRALAYSALAVLDMAKPKWHYSFPKVYFVGLLNYNHFIGRKNPVTKVMLQTLDEAHIVTNKNYLQIFVELPKLAASQNKPGELFLRALRDIGKTDTRPEEYSDESLDILFRASAFHSLSAEEQAKYSKEMTTEEDYRDYYKEFYEREMNENLEKAKADVASQALQQGIQQGIQQAKVEVAKKMLAEGISIETVMACTGLSASDILQSE